MSQYFSNMPREFLHHNVSQNHPLDLNGNITRLDKKQNTNGNWDNLINRTQDFQIIKNPNNYPQTYQNQDVQDRSIYPVDNCNNNRNVKQEGIRIINNKFKNNNQDSGNINQLFDKGEQKIQHKQKKYYKYGNNDESTQNLDQHHLKHWEKKEQEFQYSNIHTLPGQIYKEKKHQIDNLNNNCRMRKQLNLRSEIDTIPGQDTCKKISKEQQPQQKTDLYYKKFQHNTVGSVSENKLPENMMFKQKHIPSENDKHCQQYYDIVYNEKEHLKSQYKNYETSEQQQIQEVQKNRIGYHRKGLSGMNHVSTISLG